MNRSIETRSRKTYNRKAMNTTRPKNPRVHSERRFQTNIAALAELIGYEVKPVEEFTFSQSKRTYELRPAEESQLFFALLLNLSTRVTPAAFAKAIDVTASDRSNAEIIRRARFRFEQRAALAEELRETENLAASRDTNDPTAARARVDELRRLIGELDSETAYHCRYCGEGNPRVRSSVNPAVFVHTDTPVGRVVCIEPERHAEIAGKGGSR